MNLTDTYTAMHEALEEIAQQEGLKPYDCRVLLAVFEYVADDIPSDALESALASAEGSNVRRSLLSLYASGHAVGTAPDGGPRRPGQRSRITLTPRGREVARAIMRMAAS